MKRIYEIKKKSGITLIALVITIIVLLILAGITVAQLSGSGLFESAKLAKEKYQKAKELEDETIEDYEDVITGNRGNKITYSLNEQEVGTFLDGKTIYQKTLLSTTTTRLDSTSSWLNVTGWSDTSSLNIDKYVSIQYNNVSFSNRLDFKILDNNNLQFYSLISSFDLPANSMMTIQYTKK